MAFELAMKRRRRLCSVEKSNVLEASQLWKEVVIRVAKDYPEVELSHMYIDNAAMQMIRNPRSFDTIVTGSPGRCRGTALAPAGGTEAYHLFALWGIVLHQA